MGALEWISDIKRELVSYACKLKCYVKNYATAITRIHGKMIYSWSQHLC